MGVKQLTVNKDELYGLIKEAVREVIHKDAYKFIQKNRLHAEVSEELIR